MFANVHFESKYYNIQLTFLLKNSMDKYRRAAASAQYAMHQMSPSSLSPLGNRLSQTVLLGLITHLDFWPKTLPIGLTVQTLHTILILGSCTVGPREIVPRGGPPLIE